MIPVRSVTGPNDQLDFNQCDHFVIFDHDELCDLDDDLSQIKVILTSFGTKGYT